MRRRQNFLLAVACATTLIMLAGCSDNGTGPAQDLIDQAASLAAGGNSGNKKGGGNGGGGGSKLNCNKDKSLDNPAQIQLIDPENAMRIHIVASAGSDASNGVVIPNWYEVVDAGGTVYNVPTGLYVGDSSDLLDIHVDGLRPGGTYHVRLRSQDLCGNGGYSADRVITMPSAANDQSSPVVGTPVARTKSVFIATFRVVDVSADDDTGISKVEYFYNGQLQFTVDPTQQLRWWLDGNPPEYEWIVPDALRGTSGTVTVRVTDPANRVTEKSAYLSL